LDIFYAKKNVEQKIALDGDERRELQIKNAFEIAVAIE
jgi:hypothetical protein